MWAFVVFTGYTIRWHSRPDHLPQKGEDAGNTRRSVLERELLDPRRALVVVRCLGHPPRLRGRQTGWLIQRSGADADLVCALVGFPEQGGSARRAEPVVHGGDGVVPAQRAARPEGQLVGMHRRRGHVMPGDASTTL